MDVAKADNQFVADRAGVHVKTVSKWLHNKQLPTMETAIEIAKALGVDAALLWYGETRGKKMTLLPNTPSTVDRVLREAPMRRVPPRAYGLIDGYLNMMEAAGVSPDGVSRAETLFLRSHFGLLMADEGEQLSEEDQVTNVEATWAAIQEVYRRKYRVQFNAGFPVEREDRRDRRLGDGADDDRTRSEGQSHRKRASGEGGRDEPSASQGPASLPGAKPPGKRPR